MTSFRQVSILYVNISSPSRLVILVYDVTYEVSDVNIVVLLIWLVQTYKRGEHLTQPLRELVVVLVVWSLNS